MKKRSAQISIMIVCLIVGIMLSVQFRTQENYDNNLRESRINELTLKLNTATEERDALAEEVLSLQEKLGNARDTNKAMADLQEDLKNAQRAAGLLPVDGPGIEVTLNDSLRSIQAGDNPNNLLVHDVDILRVVNEMRASGAEAISVNNQRLTTMSEIRCAGTTILVNWNKIAPPFQIRAIGNPDILESGLGIKGGYLEYLKAIGVQVQMQKTEKIEMPAYSGPLRFEYSFITTSQEKKAE